MSDEKNLYEILEIPVGSGEIAIKRAYRRLNFKYHPDTRGELPQEKIAEYDRALSEIKAAYEVLRDPEMKGAYDSVIVVLEEQEQVSWNDPYQTQGVWNMPNVTPQPYMPFTSGSAYSIPNHYGMPFTSGSMYSAPVMKTRYNIRIDDVVSLGLTGITIGQILNVYISGAISIVSPVSTFTANAVQCRVISVHYGSAPGLPVYADFELEEI